MTRRFHALVFIPLLVLSLYALLGVGTPWRGEWNWTFDAVTGTTVLTGPALGALASWSAMNLRGLDPVTAALGRARLIPLRLTLECSLLGCTVYALTAVTAVLITATSTHGGPAQVWTLLIGTLVLALCAAAGVAAGWLAPARLTAVITALTIFAMGAFAPQPVGNLLRQGPSTGSLAGLRYDPRVWSGQAATLIGIIAICLALQMLARRRWPQVPIIAAVMVGLIATGAGLSALNGTSVQRFTASSERADSCRGSAPRVCVAPSNPGDVAGDPSHDASKFRHVAAARDHSAIDVHTTAPRPIPRTRRRSDGAAQPVRRRRHCRPGLGLAQPDDSAGLPAMDRPGPGSRRTCLRGTSPADRLGSRRDARTLFLRLTTVVDRSRPSDQQALGATHLSGPAFMSVRRHPTSWSSRPELMSSRWAWVQAHNAMATLTALVAAGAGIGIAADVLLPPLGGVAIPLGMTTPPILAMIVGLGTSNRLPSQHPPSARLVVARSAWVLILLATAALAAALVEYSYPVSGAVPATVVLSGLTIGASTAIGRAAPLVGAAALSFVLANTGKFSALFAESWATVVGPSSGWIALLSVVGLLAYLRCGSRGDQRIS